MDSSSPDNRKADRHDETDVPGNRDSEASAVGAHSHTHQSTRAILARLAKATGHLSGVRRMIEEGRDCADVLIQLAAVRSAISSICRIILSDHLNHCIIDAIETEDMETIRQFSKALEVFLK